MNITDVKVRRTFDEGPMRAVVSVTFDNMLAVHDIKLICVHDRSFLVMPGRKKPDGTYRDMVHPVNSGFRSRLEEAVIAEYRRVAESEADVGPIR